MVLDTSGLTGFTVPGFVSGLPAVEVDTTGKTGDTVTLGIDSVGGRVGLGRGEGRGEREGGGERGEER